MTDRDVVMRTVTVVGARPNFMKAAPILREIAARDGIESFLVHTGQHYDQRMSDSFFGELGLPRPDATLEVGSGSHAYQTSEVMKRIEPVLQAQRPHAVIVVGDVNSTVASALTAAKMGLRVAHIEAGLRSFDRGMPEELNRIVTDAIADLLFTTEQSANENLRREGIPDERVHFVGNTMVDSLLHHLEEARGRSEERARLGVVAGADYALLTLHRPSNVDGAPKLQSLLGGLTEIADRIPILFPCHPRTRSRLESFGLGASLRDLPICGPGLYACEPLGYLDFTGLLAEARLVLTDSGGIQEETTCLGVPCLTLRDNTERPVTVSLGTNRVVGSDPRRVVAAATEALASPAPPPARPPLWDGRAAARIVDVLLSKRG